MSSTSTIHDINAAPPPALECPAFTPGAEERAAGIAMARRLRACGAGLRAGRIPILPDSERLLAA